MESERLRITLNNADRIYYAGDIIRGQIWMNISKRTKIRAIKIQVTGKGKCKWMEILRKSTDNNEYSRSLFYTSKEIYEHSETALPDFEPRGVELSHGEHTYEFSIALGHQLPSSFKGSYGSIKYKMRVLIQRPWTFDERHTIPFTVVKNMPVSELCTRIATPLEKQITKTISLFGTRPITMVALLPQNFGVRGEPLSICVTVMNNSTTNVEKLRFTILQYITYYSHVPLRINKVECIAIATKETGGVQKKSERSFAHELLMPDTAQPSDTNLSGVITITYEMRVVAVLRGLFKNLELNLPFTVYAQDASTRNAIQRPFPPTRPNNGPPDIDASGGATNDSVATVATVAAEYATLDSSIGSPSRSSQYSEYSSQLSTMSDSSSFTISELPHNQTNSSGVSNVPYMPYSPSPIMVQSYPPLHAPHIPPYPLPDSPQYSLLAATPPPPPPLPASAAPPPPSTQPPLTQPATAPTTSATPPLARGYSQLPSTSTSASFLHLRQPLGAHELPPSYESLFGSLAPPETPK